jgi:GRAS domain family
VIVLSHGVLFYIKEIENAMKEMYSKLPNIKYCLTVVTETICNAFLNHDRVHVIKLGNTQLGLIPIIMKKLASRNGSIASFRYTNVAYGEYNDDYKNELFVLANQLGMKFEFKSLNIDLHNLKISMLNLREKEAIAVSCCLELHKTMDASVIRFNPRDTLLRVNSRFLYSFNC